MKSPLLLFAFAAATIATTNAGLVISEIDLANNKVEILNTGPGTENLTPYYLCNRILGNPRYPAINSLAIDVPNSSNGTLILAAGQWVTLIAAAGTITDTSGELGLYKNNLDFASSANMLDYVAWGANATRDSVAASLGIWGLSTFIVVSGITAGQTIQLGAGLPGNSVAHYTLAASTIGVNQVTPPPSATTGSASGIAANTATLSGTVNAKGVSTTVTFEYGETLAYGSSIAATPSPVTGTTDTAVSAAIAGLVPGTPYNFRLVATSANGTTFGANQPFSTTGAPVEAPLVITAVSRSGSTLTVDFTGPPNVLAADWEVGGSTTLTGFPDDKTADTMISEDPLGSGNYEALIDVTGDPATYLIRILLP